jgi:hypothetical protein
VLYAIAALVEVLVLQQRGLRMYVAGSLSSYIRPLVYAPVYLRLSLAYAVSLSFREIELIVALMFSLFPLFPDAVAVSTS